MKDYIRTADIWDLFSKFVLLSLFILQVPRWFASPRDADILYHLHSAWGFIQAGGYSGWDFWEYAPFGRMNVYPPFFQMLLALLIKLGISPVILAKFFETFTPVIFLVILWRFIRDNYGRISAFFILFVFVFSFDYCIFLSDHIPSTIALIFGISAFDGIFKGRLIRPAVFLTLCFYTHTGVSLFIALALLLYLIFDRRHLKNVSLSLSLASIFALPVLIKYYSVVDRILPLWAGSRQRMPYQIKIFDYILLSGGILLALKLKGKHYLFVCLFLASAIFLIYPHRFFQGEGYLPVIMLSSVVLSVVWERLNPGFFKGMAFFTVAFALLYALPFLPLKKEAMPYKNVTMWRPDDYSRAASLIRKNSENRDVVYCNMDYFALALGVLSGRATANALFPEIPPSLEFDPLATSNIIVLTKDMDPFSLSVITGKYGLQRIGETRLFVVYRNNSTPFKAKVAKASVPFRKVILLFPAALCIFLISRLKKFFLKS